MEREELKKLKKIAPLYGAQCYIFSDNSHRKMNSVPFDAILYFPRNGNRFAFIEAKIGDNPLTDEQMCFAKKCAVDRAKHFVLRIYRDKYVISVIDALGFVHARQEWSFSELEDVVFKIGKILSDN